MELFLDGKTKYKIVIAKDAGKYEQFAKSEFLRLFKAVSGIVLSEQNSPSKEKNIVIGRHSDFESVYANLSACNAFYLDKNIFIVGDKSINTIYSVYEFFGELFNYEYYAKDEFYIEKHKSFIFDNLNISINPDIKGRALGFTPDTWEADSEYLHRLKLNNTLYHGWILSSHSYFTVLPKEIYFDSHKDWYSSDGENLCLTNTQMRKEFVNRLKSFIDQDKTGEYIMIGQEDNFKFCDCPACTEEVQSYGSKSAVMMRFSNYVAREIKKYLSQTDSKRDLTVATFAYNKTYDAPVVIDKATNEFIPADKSVIAEDNLAVMVVPYSTLAVYSRSFFDEKYNAEIKKTLQAWSCVSSKIHIWIYSVAFDNYMYPFCDYNAIDKNYRIFKRLGVQFLFNEGNHETTYEPFHDLKVYLSAKLMWNSSLLAEDLIDAFIKNYYKLAYAQVKEVLYTLIHRWEYVENEYNCLLKSSAYLSNKEYWPKELLIYCLELLCEGEKKADNAVIAERVRREKIFLRYMLLHLHSEIYGENLQKVIGEFEADCKEYGIKAYGWYGETELIRDFSKKRRFEE